MGAFFVDRPVFATVISLIIVIIGAIAFRALPVEQYPEIAPPSIVVRASYPGADAETVAATVATPIEQEVNGVEGMLYMSSYSTADGQMALTVTFALGTDLDQAQVLVQNRVASAEPRLPEPVRALGVTTTKSSPDLMMVVHMLSPDGSFDQLYVSNYARARVRDRLVRLSGVGDLQIFGEREFALRVWLDPDRLTFLGLTAGDVLAALREQNVQVSGGALGAPPNEAGAAFQVPITTLGRLADPTQFEQIIVRTTPEGRIVRVRDVARIELGARDYVTNSYLNGSPAVALGIFQRPGSNALASAAEIIATMDSLAADFPPGLEYRVVYNPTQFIEASVDAVYTTIFEAAALVVIVILIFLRSWRTAAIPILAIPVSLVGTFAVMLALGFSLNLLTLFGLVLAIGIVVDDAIVVVENVERNIRGGLAPKAAARLGMREVSGAVVATTLVLVAVFVPTAFVPGIAGRFYQQFAVTIAVSTIISSIVSLTLSPTLAGMLMQSHRAAAPGTVPGRLAARLAGGFDAAFEAMATAYAALVRRCVSTTGALLAMAGMFAVLLYGAWALLERTPTGFIPTMDQGYAIVVVQLPEGASLERTDRAILDATEIALATPGVSDAVAFAGFSGATFTNASNQGVIFTPFRPFAERLRLGLSADRIIGDMFARLQAIGEAFVIAIPPPPVSGIGTSGGFKIQLQDVGATDMARVMGAARDLMARANQDPRLTGVFTTFSNESPQIFLEIDRVRAQMLNVPLDNVFEALATSLGVAYVNDFNAFGRVFQVRAQADAPYRLEPADIRTLTARSAYGALVPLGSFVAVVETAGPPLVQRYNLLVSVPVQGSAVPGVSTGAALEAMEAFVAETAPPGIAFEWTELAYQERTQGGAAAFVFMLAVVFAFLVLAAQYESWVLPLAIVLIVPLSVLAALIGVVWRGMDNNVLTQVGLIVLVGLAAKNAILIVEFAKQAQEERRLGPVDAAVEAARLRLRPILMTALAFILGVIPLVLAEGPGAEMRQAIGTAVFAGMLGVTLFGLVLTPAFYVALRRLLPGPGGAAGAEAARGAADEAM